jgi:ABC-type multidrug transport system fused ATPase/permease subunit
MNEPLLRSILRLYALFAGSDGLLDGEKKRISRFLSTHLSTDSVAHFIQLLEKWCLEYAPNFGNKIWLEGELREISQTVNKELLLSQRYYLFLELIELSLSDNQISLAEDEILNLLPGLLNLPEGDVAILREFALGNGNFSTSDKDVLIVSDFKPLEIPENNFWAFPGFSGNLAILKLGGTDTYFVQYKGTKETTLNGQIMEPGISRIWAPGASLRQQGIGPVFFSYIQERNSDPGVKPKINFQASNLSLRFPDGRIGLNDISLSEKGGRMVAIMGASGCGKSTLLNVLNGNEKPDQGKILINGLDVHRDAIELEGVIGYIPQDDLLNERLTVFENMYFAAKFSFGNLPEHEIVSMADQMLDSLGLAATRDKEVGSPAK